MILALRGQKLGPVWPGPVRSCPGLFVNLGLLSLKCTSKGCGPFRILHLENIVGLRHISLIVLFRSLLVSYKIQVTFYNYIKFEMFLPVSGPRGRLP